MKEPSLVDEPSVRRVARAVDADAGAPHARVGGLAALAERSARPPDLLFSSPASTAMTESDFNLPSKLDDSAPAVS